MDINAVAMIVVSSVDRNSPKHKLFQIYVSHNKFNAPVLNQSGTS